MNARLLTALLGSALAILAAPSAQADEKNNILSVAVSSSFTSIDPWDSSDNLSQSVSRSFYESLLKFDQKMQFQPNLAEAWEVSADGLTYTFHLRKGVKFHDGTEFSAAAVKANFDRVTDPKNHLRREYMYRMVDHTEVVDNYTVRVVLKHPFSPFLNQVASASAGMVCPSAIEKYGRDVAFHPCGTGPYLLEAYNPSEFLRVRKNPAYHRAGYPKLDGIDFRVVVENTTRSAMMETGEAQFAFPMPAEQAKRLERNPNLDVVRERSTMTRLMQFNMLQKPFDDVRVRRAINMAVNRQALCKVAFGGAADPVNGMTSKAIRYAAEYEPVPYDPDGARRLLREAGVPEGFETTLWSDYNDTTSVKVIQFIQQQLRQVGLKVEVRALEAGQRVELVEQWPDPKTAPTRLHYSGWSASTGEIDNALRPMTGTEAWAPSMDNVSYYSNPKVDALFAEALRTSDEEKKTAIYKDLQDILMDEVPMVTFVSLQNISVKRKNVEGFVILPFTGFDFNEAHFVR